MNHGLIRSLFTLEFGGIRSSLKNLLCGGTKNMALSFITAISKWGGSHGWRYMKVALEPIGPMPGYLKTCGFGDKGRDSLKISDIKCKSVFPLMEIKENCDLYRGEDITSFLRSRDLKIVDEIWFDLDIAKQIHDLLSMSYPDIEPTPYMLEYIYTESLVMDRINFSSEKNGIFDPITLDEYCQVSITIDEMPDGRVKEGLRRWLTTFNKNYKSEVDSKIIEIENIAIELEDVAEKLKNIYSQDELRIINKKNYLDSLNWNEKYRESYSDPDYAAYVDTEKHIYLFKKLYELKARSDRFMTWYTSALCAISTGVDIQEELKQIKYILAPLKRKFQQIIEDVEPLTRVRNSLGKHIPLLSTMTQFLYKNW